MPRTGVPRGRARNRLRREAWPAVCGLYRPVRPGAVDGFCGPAQPVANRGGAARHETRSAWSKPFAATSRLFDGLPELVEKLAARYALALASGSERPVVEEVLRLKGWAASSPPSSATRRSHAASRRPISSSARRSCSRWRRKSCCVVEDSKPGVAAGLAAGMQVIAITNTHPTEDLRHATQVVRTYEEIERLLLGRQPVTT